MSKIGSAFDLEARWRLAVACVNKGWARKDVAAFLDVSLNAVGNWMAAYRASGGDGLKAKPRPGPKPKLAARQEQGVLSWMSRSPNSTTCPIG